MPKRSLLLLLSAVAGCSGGGGGGPIDAAVVDGAVDAAIDAPACLDCDGPPACAPWLPTRRPARSLDLYDERAPITSARTFRVVIEYDGREDDLPAMPDLVRGNGILTITPRVFAPLVPTGAGPRIRRLIVPLVLPTGTWRLVADAPAPAPTLAVTVGPAPLRPCGLPIGCAMDCDCNQQAGERCLSGTGFGGGFTACARPCELDRDCGGRGSCQSIPDGLADTCQDGPPECSANAPCPTGFACQQGGCMPTFVLDGATRHPCTCDGDCAVGLRCLAASPAAPGRCQAECPTGGPWCQGPHVCGTAAQDVSGLATTDSVCGWVGE